MMASTASENRARSAWMDVEMEISLLPCALSALSVLMHLAGDQDGLDAKACRGLNLIIQGMQRDAEAVGRACAKAFGEEYAP